MPKTDFHLTRATRSSSRRRQSARTTSQRGCSLACRARSSPSLTRSLSRAQWWMRLCPTRRSSSFLGGQPTFSCLRSESTSSDTSCVSIYFNSIFLSSIFSHPKQWWSSHPPSGQTAQWTRYDKVSLVYIANIDSIANKDKDKDNGNSNDKHLLSSSSSTSSLEGTSRLNRYVEVRPILKNIFVQNCWSSNFPKSYLLSVLAVIFFVVILNGHSRL